MQLVWYILKGDPAADRALAGYGGCADLYRQLGGLHGRLAVPEQAKHVHAGLRPENVQRQLPDRLRRDLCHVCTVIGAYPHHFLLREFEDSIL